MNVETAITIDHLRQMPVGEITALPAVVLARLQKEADEAMAQMKQLHELLNGMIARRFGDRATTIRRESGKDFGLIRFQEGSVEIAVDLPKRPSWDQTQLAAIVRNIREAGDDPSQYVETAYDVPERKYTAWPDSIRRVFEPARTVKPGKATFKLTLKEQETA